MKYKILFILLFIEFNLFSESSIQINNEVIRLSFKYKVNPNLVFAIIECESTFNERAISKNISGSGMSIGLMQLNTCNRNWPLCDYFNVSKNIEEGVKTLKECLELSKGDIDKALIYYNFGYGNYEMKKRPLPQITINYVKKVKSYYIYYMGKKQDILSGSECRIIKVLTWRKNNVKNI